MQKSGLSKNLKMSTLDIWIKKLGLKVSVSKVPSSVHVKPSSNKKCGRYSNFSELKALKSLVLTIIFYIEFS